MYSVWENIKCAVNLAKHMKRVHADTIDDKNLRKNEPSKKALSNSNIEQLLDVSE